MTQSTSPKTLIKRSVWLGIVVGWLSQLGLKTILPIAVLVGLRSYSHTTGDTSLWMEHPDDSTHPVWYALQASIFLGSAFAGALAAMLSPRKSLFVPVVLIMLNLLATFFEQFPRPLSNTVTLVWVAGPCVGLLVGWLLARVFMRSNA